MPQRGGLRLTVAALTCVAGLGLAASASANEIVLEAGGGTLSPGTSATVSVPPGLVLKQALLTRSTTFPEGSSGAYTAIYKWYTGPETARVLHTQEIDGATTSVTGDVSPAIPDAPLPSGGAITFALTGAGASAEFTRIGFKVDDPSDPTAAVGGIGNTISAPLIDPKKDATPDNIAGPTKVAVWANDNGAGLWKAELYIDGQKAGTVEYVNDGDGAACVASLNAGTALPLDNDCQKNGRKDIAFDSTQWADGPHTLAVKLYDASGRVADVLKDYATTFVNHPDHGTKSADLSIGSGAGAQPNGSSSGNNGSGGVAGESTTSCNSPRLSMELSQKPLKLSRGVPVLVSGKRYRFRGKLTCIIGTKRRAAPAKTPIELFNTIGKRTYRKGGATVRNKGAITIILAYKSSRTLVFRYTNPDGRRSQVKLKIKVVKKSR